MEMQQSTFLRQSSQFLQQVLSLNGLTTGVQHTGQDERARDLNKLLCMVLADLILALLDEVECLGYLLLGPLQFIPLVGKCGETDQRIRHIERVLYGLSEHLSIKPGRRVQLSLPGA